MTQMPIKMNTILATAECLYDFNAIEKALANMAASITQKLQNKNPVLLCVMTGAVIPMGHLLTRLLFPLQIDYVHVTRYAGKTTGGQLHWLVKPRCVLKNRTILIVDDVFDGGVTLAAIIDYCHKAGAKEVLSAVMVDKQRPREPGVNFEPNFIGVKTENKFLIGFGLDYEGYMRNLPGIYAVAEEYQ